MTARLLFTPVLRALDEDGNPISGALLYGYLTGGTTATPLYTTSALTTQHTNPVVADADGWFPPIFLSDAITYRFVMKDAGGTTLPGWDVDPYTMPTVLSTEQIQDIVGAMFTAGGGNGVATYDDAGGTVDIDTDYTDAKPIECMVIPLSDTGTAPAAGVSKFSMRAPFAMTLTSIPRASLATAQTSGTVVTVDINEAGSTILSTKLTIDNGEKTSTTAATAAVLSDTAIADDAELTFDIDSVGDGTARGLNVTVFYRRA